MTRAITLHAERSGEITLPAPLEQVFPLFTPQGEKHWAHGWNPQFRYPASGEPEVGSVFLTTHGDDTQTVWVMTHYAPEAGQIAYARVTEQLAAGMVVVQCTATSSQATTVRVTYQMTALSEAGNELVATYAQEHDPDWLGSWETAILHYLHSANQVGHL